MNSVLVSGGRLPVLQGWHTNAHTATSDAGSPALAYTATTVPCSFMQTLTPILTELLLAEAHPVPFLTLALMLRWK